MPPIIKKPVEINNNAYEYRNPNQFNQKITRKKKTHMRRENYLEIPNLNNARICSRKIEREKSRAKLKGVRGSLMNLYLSQCESKSEKEVQRRKPRSMEKLEGDEIRVCWKRDLGEKGERKRNLQLWGKTDTKRMKNHLLCRGRKFVKVIGLCTFSFSFFF